MGRKRHNPERRAWRGRSYKKGVRELRVPAIDREPDGARTAEGGK